VAVVPALEQLFGGAGCALLRFGTQPKHVCSSFFSCCGYAMQKHHAITERGC